jgi:hypothetical protein
MANQEQLDILKQGVETWNQWRNHQYSGTFIDLRDADLLRILADMVVGNQIHPNLQMRLCAFVEPTLMGQTFVMPI